MVTSHRSSLVWALALLTMTVSSLLVPTPLAYNRLSSSTTTWIIRASNEENEANDSDDFDLSLEAFQQERDRRTYGNAVKEDEDDEVFDGYALRDVILEKWGECFDVEFQRVEAMDFKEVYLNIMPFRLGSRNFRHSSEMDYLCHLQAVVEILDKYNQIGVVLYQIDQTNKKPRAGTSPLVAVPLRLDLTKEQVNRILG